MTKKLLAYESWLAYYDADGDVSNWNEVADKRTAALRKGFKYLVKTRFYSNNTFHIELAFHTKADAVTFAKSLINNNSGVFVWATVSRMHGANVYSDGTTGDYHYQYLTYVADFYNKTA